jgi:hypothetical protein
MSDEYSVLLPVTVCAAKDNYEKAKSSQIFIHCSHFKISVPGVAANAAKVLTFSLSIKLTQFVNLIIRYLYFITFEPS